VNPAVSTALLVKGAITAKEYMFYTLAQYSGAFFGGALAWWLLDEMNSPFIPDQSWDWMVADIIGEMFATFIFITIILIMTNEKTSFANNYPLLIFFSIAAALFFARQLTYHSGGALNPGIALGLEVFQSAFEDDWSRMNHSYVYLIGPYLGGILAPIFFENVYEKYVKKNQLFSN